MGSLALRGYRDAMTYVLQLAEDDGFEYHEQLFKGLHFMMTDYSLRNRPGRWRSGSIFVARPALIDIRRAVLSNRPARDDSDPFAAG